jgi:hypothetical protein
VINPFDDQDGVFHVPVNDELCHPPVADNRGIPPGGRLPQAA